MVVRKTNIEFIGQLWDSTRGKYRPLEKYVNAKTKILMHCNTCNENWKANPAEICKGRYGCPYCAGTHKKTTTIFSAEIKQLTKGEYILLSEYTNNKTKVEILHVKCKKTFLVKPNNFLGGTRCPYCSHGHLNKGNDTFIKELKEVWKDLVIPTSNTQYITGMKKVEVLCTKCGQTFKMTPQHLLQHHGCPSCNRNYTSNIKCYGEQMVERYLKQERIEFLPQKRFDDLYIKKPLSYDFYFEYDNKKYVVEYQGQQHYKPCRFSQSVSKEQAKIKFDKQQERDSFKRNYAKKNGLIEIEIPYKINTQDKINHFLDNILK